MTHKVFLKCKKNVEENNYIIFYITSKIEINYFHMNYKPIKNSIIFSDTTLTFEVDTDCNYARNVCLPYQLIDKIYMKTEDGEHLPHRSKEP